MFSPNSPSPSSNPPASRHPRPRSNTANTSFTLPPPITKQPLPSGECRFILLHPSISDQRCSCQGFRRNESRPGANCECGHQACYHAPGANGGMLNGPSPVEGSVSPPAASGLSVMTLMERICRLEEQHQHDRKLWEDELKEERRARREDARVLREAMYSFYKFMEREVPGKFVAVDDKIDGLLDSVSRLEERIGVIDDSTMALENRVADLEAGGDGDAEDENGQLSGNNVEGEESNHNRPKREISADHAQPVRGTITSPRSNGASQPRTRSPVASMAPPAHPVNPRSVSPCPSTNLISHSPKATDENSAFPLELLEAPAPITGAHTYVNTLSSPSQDFVPPVLPRRDSVTGKPLFHATSPSHDVPLIKPPLPPSSSSTSRIDHTISTSQHLPPATCPTTIEDSAGPYCELPSPLTRKRKFDVDGRETGPRQQRPMFIPMPPPLSLSGSNLKA